MLAEAAGYKLNIANKGRIPYDPNTITNKSQFKDIEITRPGQVTDMYDLHSRALLTVNGFIHPTSFIDGRLFVDNAMTSLFKTGHNHVGIMSFFNLDQELEKIHITEDMITQDGDYPLCEKAIITLPKQLDGVILSFAGYTIFENERYLTRVSDRSFVIYPSRFGLMDKIYELNRYYNIFDDLGIEVSTRNDSVVTHESITSNDTIIKLLTRFNTFFIHTRGHLIEPEIKPLEHTAVPNNFRTQGVPKYPMFGGRGKILEYKFKKFNNYKFNVLTVDAYYDNLVNSYTPIFAIDLVSKARLVGDTYRLSSAIFIDIKMKKMKK